VDPDMSQPDGMISYHDNRRGSRMISLRSYGNPSSEDKFSGLDYFDLQLKDVSDSLDHKRLCDYILVCYSFN
jgi:hypothetical protein